MYEQQKQQKVRRSFSRTKSPKFTISKES